MTSDPHDLASALDAPLPDPDDVAYELADLRQREREAGLRIADLERQLEDATARAGDSPPLVTSFDQLDEGELAELVGEETAKVLAAARNAAQGIVGNAERTAAQMRAKADRDADRLAVEADERLERSIREADAEAARRLEEADTAIGLAHAEAQQHGIRARLEAEAAVAEISARAERELDDAHAQAQTIVERSRHDARSTLEQAAGEGQALVAEAQAVRARMLEDLLRRRKLLRRQVEQLEAGRQRLVAVFDVVHAAMGTVDAELAGVLEEAKAAADEAAARADASPDDETIELQHLAEQARAAAGIEPEPPADDVAPADEVVPSVDAAADDSAVDEGADADPASSVFTRLRAEPEPVVTPTNGADDPSLGAEVEGVRLLAPVPQPTELEVESNDAIDPEGAEEQDEDGADDVVGALEQRDRLLEDLARTQVRRIKRLLSDEQNELLDTVRRRRPLPYLDELLASEAEHERRYAEAALPALRKAVMAGYELPAIVREQPLPPPGPDAAVVDLAAVLAVEVVGALRTRLAGCMSGSGAEALRAAPPNARTTGTGTATATKAARSAAADALAGDVRLVYREVRDRKVDAAAATAIHEAFARGLRAQPDPGADPLTAELLTGLPTG